MIEMRRKFEESFKHTEGAVLKFYGVDDWDVYNCSVPFTWQKKRYLFGRVERRNEWMRSFVRLFEEQGEDEWKLVDRSMVYCLEDPCIAKIGDELILEGTHVRLNAGELDAYYCYFYRGKELDDLRYFTTGPDYMKDIRLAELPDGRVGVFTRPRGPEILRKHGSESIVGFIILDDISQLNAGAIAHALPVKGLFGKRQWGGCNQAYLLDSGKIGVVGHASYQTFENGQQMDVYMNMSFVMDPYTRNIEDYKVIGTKECYPCTPAKRPNLADCAFTSGIVMRPDGDADLYSGLGDCAEGRIKIPYPFRGYGSMIEKEEA